MNEENFFGLSYKMVILQKKLIEKCEPPHSTTKNELKKRNFKKKKEKET